jgi:SAM-dependent methyltransferase
VGESNCYGNLLLRYLGAGVYLLDVPPDGEPPREIKMNGARLTRFMDAIYLSCPPEILGPAQISVVNHARRELVTAGRINIANLRVRRMFAQIVEVLGVRDLLEWGCGYDSMSDEISWLSSFQAVDIDPRVVAWQTAQGISCWHRDELLTTPLNARFDAIISIFVFHFDISQDDIRLMNQALREGGWILANVYRRTALSRSGLRRRFEYCGLRVYSIPDREGLCREHEFWCIMRADDILTEIAGRILRYCHAVLVG